MKTLGAPILMVNMVASYNRQLMFQHKYTIFTLNIGGGGLEDKYDQ